MNKVSQTRRGGRWLNALAVFVFGWAVIAPAHAESERSYVIKKNDTLSRIARQHGVSLSDLARYNGLSPKDTIYTGQRLLIPSPNLPSYRRVLPPAVRAAIDNASVRRGRWKYIVIHHSGTACGTVKGMDAYHREVRHMENGLAYHFVVGNGDGMPDGSVAVGARWKKQLDGGHLATVALNKVSIGICLVGNFDQKKPTRKQMTSLKALLQALMVRCGLGVDAVKTHQQINPVHTRCPGRRFSSETLLKELKKLK